MRFSYVWPTCEATGGEIESWYKRPNDTNYYKLSNLTPFPPFDFSASPRLTLMRQFRTSVIPKRLHTYTCCLHEALWCSG